MKANSHKGQVKFLRQTLMMMKLSIGWKRKRKKVLIMKGHILSCLLKIKYKKMKKFVLFMGEDPTDFYSQTTILS